MWLHRWLLYAGTAAVCTTACARQECDFGVTARSGTEALTFSASLLLAMPRPCVLLPAHSTTRLSVRSVKTRALAQCVLLSWRGMYVLRSEIIVVNFKE